MELIYEGKTKNVYKNPNGNITLKLKDDATGKDGVFDPGENAVGLSIEGLGRESLRLTTYYFNLLSQHDIPNHFINSDISNATMEVKPAVMFGKGIEFICRVKADGSFIRRYGAYTNKGDDLDYLVEVTLKDDNRNDPPATKETLTTLNILTPDQYDICTNLTKKSTKIIATDLQKKGLQLYDLKFEFGLNNNTVILIDEISAGCMRVYKDEKIVPPMDLGGMIL